jgi:putative FmdB family regulatory protein
VLKRALLREAAVPVYAYRCLDCGEIFEKVEHMVDHDQGKYPPCPSCNGERVSQVFAPFFAQTHKKS